MTRHAEGGKWTEGEWSITYRPGELNDAYWIGVGPYFSIAEVRNGADDEEYGGAETELANARLIAAAPELFRALETLLTEAENFSVSGVYFTEECMGHKGPAVARAALSKAGAGE